MDSTEAPRVVWIGYTTHYRGGSAAFARAAHTLAEDLRRASPSSEVRVDALERKADFVDAMRQIASEGKTLDALHFIGHSGMYGIMFGSTAWPEQFSPHEWRQMRIPFAPGAKAYFHACRTARWFAPFFARTFGVHAYGHHNYTTVSTRPDRFAWAGLRDPRDGPLYLIACPGRKSHGLVGSARKYLGRARAEPMRGYAPAPAKDDGRYDAVADLYDTAFDDIRVRRDEWRWLTRQLDTRQAAPPRLLDIGCGNGALLMALADRLATGVGVDISPAMIERAQRRARAAAGSASHLRFVAIDGPQLPFPDASFDVVTSFLSFRYLDWDPIMGEIRRVLAPGGQLLIVDMVEKPLDVLDAPQLFRSTAQHLLRRIRNRRFDAALRRLTRDPAWQTMLKYNPIRAEHEYRWYLESRFPGRRLETLNVSRRHRLVAFNSGPLSPGHTAPLCYP